MRFVCNLLIFIALSVFALPVFAGEPLRITRIIPSGEEIGPVRQITITFNRRVVPLGEMKRNASDIPVTITPPLACSWRWIDPSNLSCDLPHNGSLQLATTYDVTVRPGIQAEDGETIKETYRHTFSTKRPAVNYTSFKQWQGLKKPIHTVYFTQPVKSFGLAGYFYFVNDDNPSKTYAAKIDPCTDCGSSSDRAYYVYPKNSLPEDTTFSLFIRDGFQSTLGSLPAKFPKGIQKLQTFATFPSPVFLGFGCGYSATPKKDGTDCSPEQTTYMFFSVPVDFSEVRDKVAFDPDLTTGMSPKEHDPQKPSRGLFEDIVYRHHHSKGQMYRVSLPHGLKPRTLYSAIVRNQPLLDVFERKIPDFMGSFKVGPRSPNFLFHYDLLVLEKGEQTDLPFLKTNIDKLSINLRKLSAQGDISTEDTVRTYQDPLDTAIIRGFKVRDFLGGRSGALFGHITKIDDVSVSDSYYKRFFAIVTPYNLSLKIGHYNSLVWVTDMKTGAPVPNATVSYYYDRMTDMNGPKAVLASAKTNKDGVALLDRGAADFKNDTISTYGIDSNGTLFLSAVKRDEIALMPLSDKFEVDTYRVTERAFYPSRQNDHLETFGFTAQGIYKPGEKVDYKVYVRRALNKTLGKLPSDTAVDIDITDPSYKTVHKQTGVKLSDFGAFTGSLDIPKNGLTGEYRASVKITTGGHTVHAYPFTFMVADFTPASFSVSHTLNATLYQPDDVMTIDSFAKLLAGGPYGLAPLRLNIRFRETPFTSAHPIARSFSFEDDDRWRYNGIYNLFEETDVLDDKGEFSKDYTMKKLSERFGTLLIESAVKDERGKYVATSTPATYFGVDRFIGYKDTSWSYEQNRPTSIAVIVTDQKGLPVTGVSVSGDIQYEEVTMTRTRGGGNVYQAVYNRKWIPAGSCTVVSDETGVNCTFTPTKAGRYKIMLSGKDTKDRMTSVRHFFYVSGSDYVLFDEDKNPMYLPILQEKGSYKVGETARYKVQNPYPGAYALITVERKGIIDSFVKKFDQSIETFDLPIKSDYMPGFYLSVTLFSPRIEKPSYQEQFDAADFMSFVDLGKPSVKMGYLKVNVSDPYKKLDIQVKPDKDTYRPKEKVTVRIKASPLHPKKTKEPIEFSVVVLDDAVLALLQRGLSYYSIYDALYRVGDLNLRNFNLLLSLVGRQKIDSKGGTQGGDGGSGSPGGADIDVRDNFKYIAYYNPSVIADAKGEATVSFTAPDNLTSFRIIVIGATPTDRMATETARIKVNKNIETRQLSVNQMSDLDTAMLGTTVLNRTDKERTVTVTLQATGDVVGGKVVEKQKVKLAPFKRENVYAKVSATSIPFDRPQGEITVKITATDGKDSDGMIYTIPVLKLRSVDTAAEYGSMDGGKDEISIAVPDNIYTDIGGMFLKFSATIISGLEGSFDYMKTYPYSCWEQKLSKASMALHYKRLKKYMPDFSWQEADGNLIQSILSDMPNFQAENGGMTYFVPRQERVSPYLSAYTALALHWFKAEGFAVNEAAEAKLHAYLKNYLKSDSELSNPYTLPAGTRTSIRAVALAALAKAGKANAEDLSRLKPYLHQMSILGKSHYLMAASLINGQQEEAENGLSALLSHANVTAGKYILQEMYGDDRWYVLASPNRENCMALSSIIAAGLKDTDNIPEKLVRTIIQSRGKKDRWENTQENIFCMNALADYSAKYEAADPNMTMTATWSGEKIGTAKLTQITQKPVDISRPFKDSDVGQKRALSLQHAGTGRAYYEAKLKYAKKAGFDQATHAGIEVRREYYVERDGAFVPLSSPMKIRRGELVLVNLFVSLPAARNYVVVNDPVPGGLEPVNRDLATASAVDADKGDIRLPRSSWFFRNDDWVGYDSGFYSFYHREMKHDVVRYYSDYLPAGHYYLSYTAQAIADGTFTAFPLYVHEMYDEDIYGRGVIDQMIVSDDVAP